MIGQVKIQYVFDFENNYFHLAMLMVYILFENSVNLFVSLVLQIDKGKLVYSHVDQKCHIFKKYYKY